MTGGTPIAAPKPDIGGRDTLPKLLAHNAANWPDDIALREKEFGIWQEITWRGYNDRTGLFALAMKEPWASTRGDVVGLIGDNRPGLGDRGDRGARDRGDEPRHLPRRAWTTRWLLSSPMPTSA